LFRKTTGIDSIAETQVVTSFACRAHKLERMSPTRHTALAAVPAEDTDADTVARQLALIRTLSKSERLARTLSLSALVRQLAWEGAARHAGTRGERAVVERFLAQLYGPELTPDLRRLISRL
jgi:hypothetical protein